MSKLKIGILCPSEIAFRRFLPALKTCEEFEYIGVAVASESEWFGKDTSLNSEVILNERIKAKGFVENFGGKVFASYSDLINSSQIDAVYIPLPPALHYKWAKLSLEAGKHILCEKPSTTSFDETNELLMLAQKKGLAFHENYMFSFHDQLKVIKEMIDEKQLGNVRLYRLAFGFPKRSSTDFRYNKALGGGALLDCGGYTVKLADMLLGGNAKIVYSKLNYTDEFEVDIFGSAALINQEGVTAQIAFGMDNSYKCDLEVWGSEGCILTGRIFSAPAGFEPILILKRGSETKEIKLPADDTFAKSIKKFYSCIINEKIRENNYFEIKHQAKLIEKIKGDN